MQNQAIGSVFSTNALLFDVDSTLLNSENAMKKIWQNFSARNQLNVDEVYDFAHIFPIKETVQRFVSKHKIKTELKQIIKEQFDYANEVSLFPYAMEFLNLLPSNRWAVITEADENLFRVKAKAANLKIPNIFITKNSIIQGKPNRKGYIEAALRLGFNLEECTIFESTNIKMNDENEKLLHSIRIGNVLTKIKKMFKYREINDYKNLFLSSIDEEGKMHFLFKNA